MKFFNRFLVFVFLFVFVLFPLSTSANVWTNLGLYGGKIYDIAIDPENPDKMFASAYMGSGLFVSQDGGNSWTPVVTNSVLDGEDTFKEHGVYDVEIAAANTSVVWVAHDYWVEKSIDGGTSWTHILNSAMQRNCTDCGGYYDSYRRCLTVASDPVDPDIVYVGTAGSFTETNESLAGAIYKTTDGGTTWAKLNLGQRFDYQVVDIAVDPQNANTIWAVTNSNGVNDIWDGTLYLSQDGGNTWNPISPKPVSGAFTSVAIKPGTSDVIFTTGGEGLIRSEWDGTRWQHTNPFPECTYAGEIRFAPGDVNTVYVSWLWQNTARVSKSNDGGDTWPLSCDISTDLVSTLLSLAIDPTDSNVVFGGDTELGVVVSRDSAQTWSHSNQGIEAVIVYDIAIGPDNKEHKIAGTGSGVFETAGSGIWERKLSGVTKSVLFHPSIGSTYYAGVQGQFARTTDSGETWTLSIDDMGAEYIYHIAVGPQNTDTIFLAVGKEIRRSTDGGNSFAQVLDSYAQYPANAEPDFNVVAINPANPAHIFAGSGNFFRPKRLGDLWESRDGGNTWQRSGLQNVIVNDLIIHPGDSNTLYAGCGYSGNYDDPLYKSTDGGLTWNVFENGLPNKRMRFLDIWYDAGDSVYFVGWDGTMLHYNGSTFTSMDSATTRDLWGIHGFSGSNIYAAGLSGAIVHYDGSAWSPMNSATSENLYDLWGEAPDNLVAVGANGTILHYDGGTWSAMVSNTTVTLYGIHGVAADDLYAVGAGGTIVHYDGSNWTVMNSGVTQGIYDIWCADASTVFAVGDAGLILHFNGNQWTVMNSDTTLTFGGVWGTEPSDVYAVGQDSILLHYDGNSWNRSAIDNAEYGEVVWAAAPDDVYVADSHSGVYHYNGTEWETLRTPGSRYRSVTDLEFHPQNLDIVYASTYKAGVFVTPNQAQNWINIGTPENSVYAIATGSLYAATQGAMLQCTGTGVIAGQVADQLSGLGIHGAMVSSDLGANSITVSGEYLMVSPAGLCELTATKDTHINASQPDISVYGGDVTWADMTMLPYAVEMFPNSLEGSNGQIVPATATVAVRINNPAGLDLSNPSSVQFTIDDGTTTYERNLGSNTVWYIKLNPEEPETAVTVCWIIYERTHEAAGNTYPVGNDIHVGIQVGGTTYATTNFTTADESTLDIPTASRPQTEQLFPDDPLLAAAAGDPPQGYDAGIRITTGDLKGAAILYNSSLHVTPSFGSHEAFGSDTLVDGVGLPLKLSPAGAFFDPPVKILIPCPGYLDVSSLQVYVYKNDSWQPACDADGNLLPGGDGWINPGSRVNHNNGEPSTIELQVYHFTGVQATALEQPAAADLEPSATPAQNSGSRGSFCFIATANGNEKQPEIGWLWIPALLLILAGVKIRKSSVGLFFFIIILGFEPLTAATLFQQVGVASSPNPVGSGARALGMGGAFIGTADDATAASWNPAGLVQLEKPEVSIVGDFYQRRSSYTSSSHPEIASTDQTGDGNLNYFSATLPFRAYKNMVVSINYQRLYDFKRELSYQYDYNSLGVQLNQNKYFSQDGSLGAAGIAYAIELTPTVSLGVTMNIWTDQLWWHNGWDAQFVENGQGTQGGAPVTIDTTISDRYSNFEGINATIGFLWEISPGLSLGGVYKSAFEAKAHHRYNAVTTNSLSGTVPFSQIEDVHIRMPLSYGAGVSWRASDVFSLGLDVYRTHWSDYLLIDSQGNRFNPIDGQPQSSSKVADTTQVRVGGEYLALFPQKSIVVPIRAGLFYDPEPSHDSARNFYGISLGSGVAYQRYVFDLAYQFRWSHDVDTGNLIATSEADITQQSFLASLIVHFN